MESLNKSAINFVAIDLETATSFRGSICQIGITEVKNGQICPAKTWYVRPRYNEYDYLNTSVHGITAEDTENSPSFPEVWKEVVPLLEGKIVVAHNTAFDMYALRDAFDDYGMEYPTFDYYCTLRIARFVVRGCPSYSLNVVLEHLGIPFKGHHHAGNDSDGCAKLLLRCLEMEGASSIADVAARYGYHKGYFNSILFQPHYSSSIGMSEQSKQHTINLRHEKEQPAKKYVKKKHSVCLEDLEAHPDKVDPNSYFNGKSVCFTGVSKYGTRQQLLQQILDVGGIPTNSVTAKTDILVVGEQDCRVVGEEGVSGKHKKALQMLEKGAWIEILGETEFLERIRS